MTKKQQQPQQLYMLSTLPWDGADWVQDRFVFHATNGQDAENKRFGWAQYQGMISQDVTMRLITPEELPHESWIHDEWVR